jgi:hypothetical protein
VCVCARPPGSSFAWAFRVRSFWGVFDFFPSLYEEDESFSDMFLEHIVEYTMCFFLSIT